MKCVLPNSPNKEIHEQIETNESNKFSSSGESKSEEDEAFLASKGQDSEKLTQTGPTAMIKQRVKNTC